MPRTTADDVRDTIQADGAVAVDLDVISDDQIDLVAIEPAALEVEEDLVGEGMSEARLEIIERYLAVDNLLDGGMDELRTLESESHQDGSSFSYADAPDYREKAKRYDKSGKLDGLEKPSARTFTPDSRGKSRQRRR